MEFKDKLFQLRMQLNMSQEMLARELGVCYATVNRWEKGVNIPRPQQTLLRREKQTSKTYDRIHKYKKDTRAASRCSPCLRIN